MFSATIQSGQTIAGIITAIGQQDMYTFTASAGDSFQATLADANAASQLEPELQLFGPDGTPLKTSVSGATNTSVTTGVYTVPSGGAGTYTLVVQNYTNGTPSTGGYNLELAQAPAVQAVDPDGDGGTISSGQTRSGSINRLGNMDIYTFTASAGNSFQATLADANAASQVEPELQLFGPDGTPLKTSVSGATNTSVTTGVYTVPSGGAGTYTLVVQNYTNGTPSTGGYNLELAQAPAVQAVDPDGDGGTISSGQTRSGSINRLGNMDIYTFTASAGNSFQATLADANAASQVEPELQLFGPDGTPLKTSVSGATNTSVTTGVYTVPSGGAGTYTLVVQNYTNGTPSTGGYNLELAQAPAVQAVDPDGDGGTISSGQTRSGSINRLGNMDIYTFTASAGNSFQATLADANAASQVEPELQLFGPDGTPLKTSVSGATNTSVTTGVYTVPSGGAGTYTLVVQNYTNGTPSTGGYNLELAQAPAVQAVDPDGDGGTISSGQTRSGSINRLGNMDIYTFTASAGNSFQATLADANAASQVEPELQLFGPDGTPLKTSVSGATNTSVTTGVYTVPSGGAGTYTLVVQNYTNGTPSTGGYNLELAQAPAVQAVDPDGDGGTISSGQTRSGSINRLGNMDIYTFTASAGNSFQATLADANAASQVEPELQLFGPDGTPLKTSVSGATNTSVTTGVYTVPSGGAGTYTLVVQNYTNGTPSTGGYILELAPAVVDDVVINGDNPNGLTAGVQRSMVEDVVYTFSSAVTIPNANAAFAVAGAGPHAGTAPATLTATGLPGSNGTQWAVTLTGRPAGVLGSIANGEYSITMNPAAVFSAADGVTPLAAGRTDQFYRLFGDINGAEAVTAVDNLQLKKALTAYNPAFDSNTDGAVTAIDNLAFKKDLTVAYFGDGFMPTL